MYSKDVRIIAKKLYLKYKSFRKVSKIIDISKSTIHRWISNTYFYKKIRKTNIFTEQIKNYIHKIIKDNPFINIKDISNNIYNNYGIKISISYISKFLKQNNYSYKKAYKKSYNVSINNLNKSINTFKTSLKDKNINDIVSIDESYFYINDIPHYGWSKKGQRIEIYKDYKRIKKSLLMAVSNKKVLKYLITDKNINKDIYHKFIKELNITNKIIVCDNVSFHKCKNIIKTIENKNCECIFTPPYSPQYNPIEMVFSEIKRYIRIHGIDKINNKINSIKSINLNNYFTYSYKNILI